MDGWTKSPPHNIITVLKNTTELDNLCYMLSIKYIMHTQWIHARFFLRYYMLILGEHHEIHPLQKPATAEDQATHM